MRITVRIREWLYNVPKLRARSANHGVDAAQSLMAPSSAYGSAGRSISGIAAPLQM